MKFSKSEIYFILVIMTVASVLIDFNDAYQSKLEKILKKIAQKTDDRLVMATKDIKNVGHAVLIAALESAINPLWDCVLKEYCDIYGLSVEELREQFPIPFNVVDKFHICLDVVDDINERMNNES